MDRLARKVLRWTTLRYPPRAFYRPIPGRCVEFSGTAPPNLHFIGAPNRSAIDWNVVWILQKHHDDHGGGGRNGGRWPVSFSMMGGTFTLLDVTHSYSEKKGGDFDKGIFKLLKSPRTCENAVKTLVQQMDVNRRHLFGITNAWLVDWSRFEQGFDWLVDWLIAFRTGFRLIGWFWWSIYGFLFSFFDFLIFLSSKCVELNLLMVFHTILRQL